MCIFTVSISMYKSNKVKGKITLLKLINSKKVSLDDIANTVKTCLGNIVSFSKVTADVMRIMMTSQREVYLWVNTSGDGVLFVDAQV